MCTTSKRGGIRAGILLFIAVLSLIAFGGQGVYTAVKNPQLVSISYDDFAAGKTDHKWIQLTNGYLDFSASFFSHRFGSEEPNKLFVPMRSRRNPMAPSHVVLVSEDKKLLAAFREFQSASAKGMAATWTARNRDLLCRNVHGVVHYGIDIGGKAFGQVENQSKDLAPNFVFFAYGKRPDLMISGAMVLLGIIVGALMPFARREQEE